MFILTVIANIMEAGEYKEHDVKDARRFVDGDPDVAVATRHTWRQHVLGTEQSRTPGSRLAGPPYRRQREQVICSLYLS
jgi:hypothetical protein